MSFAQRILAVSQDEIEIARNMLYKEMEEASKKLRAVPGVPKDGSLTPDHVRNSATFKKAKSEFDRAFQTLRRFNGKYKPKRRPRFDAQGKPTR